MRFSLAFYDKLFGTRPMAHRVGGLFVLLVGFIQVYGDKGFILCVEASLSRMMLGCFGVGGCFAFVGQSLM